MAATQKGFFLVLEGADGSGKTTQFKLLTQRLRAVGYEVETFDFPRYNEPSSHFVKSYLNGVYGPAAEISPYTASLFYALDRFEAAPQIREAIDKGRIVLSNRYVGSNMAHQGSKFNDPVQQRGFFLWEDSMEYQMLNIPRPDLNIFLKVPAAVSFELIKTKKRRDYTDKTHDEHENNLDHLRNSVATYDTLCKLFPKDFKSIECTDNNKMLSIPAINNKIWDTVKPFLPDIPINKGREVVIDLTSLQINTESENSQQLSEQSPDDDDKLTIEVENISLLAYIAIQNFKGIESNVSIDWQKGGSYKYYSLGGLPKETLDIYKKSMETFIKYHQDISENKQLVKRGVNKNILPLAALANVSIKANIDDLKQLISSLQLYPYDEHRWLAAQLNERVAKKNKTAKDLLYKTSSDLISDLVDSQLDQSLTADIEPVSLTNFSPRNEFEVLAAGLYSFSNLSPKNISEELDGWSYEKKLNLFNKIITTIPNLVLDKISYQFNIINDQQILSKILNELSVIDLQVQPPTPRYGYEVPQILENFEMEDIFIASFDESLKLFSAIQNSKAAYSSAYATLYGHRNRYQFSMNGKDALVLSKQARIKGNEILHSLLEKIEEVHPLIYTSLFNESVSSKKLVKNAKLKSKAMGTASSKTKRPKK